MHLGKSISGLAAIAIVGAVAAPVSAATFISPKGYTISSAPGWVINKSGFMGSDVFIYTKPVNKFAPNLNAIVMPASPGDTLDAAAAQIKQMYPSTFTHYHSVALTRGKLAGVPALFNVGTYLSGDKYLRMRQAMVVRAGQTFIFTCTSPEKSQAKYDPDFMKMLNSVRWR